MDQKRIDRIVHNFLNSRFYDSRRFGASSDMWIEDAERAERCMEAARDGAEGSTHYEVIQDMRSIFSDFLRYGGKRNPFSAGYDRLEAAVSAHFDELEAWHEKNGTLHEQIG